VADVQAQAGKDRQPFVQDCGVRTDISDGLDAGDVDERREEAVAEVALLVALAGEPDDGLREEAAAVRDRLAVLDIGVEQLGQRRWSVRSRGPSGGVGTRRGDAVLGEGGPPPEWRGGRAGEGRDGAGGRECHVEGAG
jgi:hypothetical protein